ncbi:Zn(2)-C6 fungal-type domain-containing protein [Mycena venus]|uniref:Zn(2)-C6 fungal-type domain-containing protein n=1 Tax=Mycena venus TaxID=2733690 RepID=A0A8H7CQ96_9AGAR|nr:Zn(2)-C6 fungal-type domain-containing protein [Mycena venus]
MSKSVEPEPEQPAGSSRPFKKRRRAYVACIACRRRKVKCVTPSDDDDTPCTRCSNRGQECEFRAVPDTESTSSAGSTPPDTPPLMLLPAPGDSSPCSATSPSVGTPEILAVDSFPLQGPANLGCIVEAERGEASMYQHDSYLLSPLHDPSPMASRDIEFSTDTIHLHAYPISYSQSPGICTPHTGHIPDPGRASWQLDLTFGAHSSATSGYAGNDFYPANVGLELSVDEYAQQSIIQCICSLGPCVCGASSNFHCMTGTTRMGNRTDCGWFEI